LQFLVAGDFQVRNVKKIWVILFALASIYRVEPIKAEPIELNTIKNTIQLSQLTGQDGDPRRQRPASKRKPRPNRNQTSQELIANGTIRVTLLGTGGGPGGGGPNMITKKMNANTLVEAGGQQFLFDAGRGAMLRIASLSPKHIVRTNKVFLTHLHSDHIVDLSDLFLNGSGQGKRTNFFVWGPIGTQAMTSHLVKAYDWDLRYRTNRRRPKLKMIGKDVREGTIYEQAGVKVTAFDVDHWPPQKTKRERTSYPAVGYRLDYSDRSVVISGDTRPTKNMIKFASGVDLLIHEVHVGLDFRKRRSGPRPLRGSHHTSPHEAGEIFTQARPKLALYTHIVWGGMTEKDLVDLTRQTYNGPLVVGQEMMQIRIGDTVEILK
jgi:ribonuclease Z